MHLFRVWAPLAERVDVKIGDALWPLAQGDGGWWEAEVAEAAPGTDYGFVLNGDEGMVLPDPRSAWQPYGVHGLSRVLDQAAFQWTDAEWHAPELKDAVIYELHVGTFTEEGTFAAAEKRLEYLKTLGVTHVELMPVAAFPGERGWGYDGVDMFAPQESYGGPDALKHLIDAAHAHGMAVLLDVVYNHLGPSGNYLSRFGPYFTGSHHTPWGDAVNFEEAGSDEVRRFFIDNAKMWLRDYHFDGLRLDAVHAYLDRSAVHFMEQMTAEVAELERETGRSYVLIAESDLNDPRVVTERVRGGYGMDAQWSDDFHHSLVALLTGDRGGYYADFGRMADVAKALRTAFVYDGKYSGYRDRVHGRPVEGLPLWRFLGFAQNHDQVGNRATGDRLHMRTSLGRVKIAAALVLMAPFVPLIFQGEEWAASSPFLYFTDHEEDLGRLVSEGRKKEFAAFGWRPEEIPDPQQKGTFLRSRLKWAEIAEPEHAGVLGWYRELIALRQTHRDDLVTGDVEVEFDEQARWLTLRRGRFVVALNAGPEAVKLAVARNAKMVLKSCEDIVLAEDGLTLIPDSVAVVEGSF
ncbi:MAG TPA: malto-oligosyltrehalose trehalohydrolase [Acidobacteriaceae bacterium]|nr:malto-oligosyltrehalose trehalohydrolase [Acidobacteriaceae bacterium]